MPRLPVLQNTDPADSIDRDAIARDLAQRISGDVRFGVHDRMLYSTDASLYQVEPLGVVIPDSTQDAVRAVRFCAERGLPILPRGGGTSLAGQGVNRAVLLDFSPKCRSILEIDKAGRRCRVEPGVAVDELNAALVDTGLFFAPDPSTSRHANVGGCVGNNAAGSRSIRYGRTSESLLGLDVCLADGRTARFDSRSYHADPLTRELTDQTIAVVREHAESIRKRFPKTIRRNAGYGLDLILDQIDADAPVNLAPLLCGSEGTLAVTLAAELKLMPRPAAKGLAVLGFGSVEHAIDAVAPILETSPSAVELLDDLIVSLARANRVHAGDVNLLPKPESDPVGAVLYVEYFADHDAAEIGERFDALRAAVPNVAIETHTDPKSMHRAWALRKAGEPLLHGIPGNRKPITFVEDNAVPIERLPEFVSEFRRIVETHGTTAAFYAHASVGVLHVRPLLDIRDPDDERRMHAIAREVAELAKNLGGVMSGEHGDGRVRGPLLEAFYGPELVRAFGQIKDIFDPERRLNPGVIVEPGPIASISRSTRQRPGEDWVHAEQTDTFYEYHDQHGFQGAIEMCNGAGVCRKKDGGTMCPSYMASLDERHSTRGRANALRLAITGQLEADRWDDTETLATLDLCLSCKACKSECPSNVDVARLKSEYQSQRYRRLGRVPIGIKMVGRVRSLSKLASRTPAFATWMATTPPARWLLKRVAGIDPRRSLPEFRTPLDRLWGVKKPTERAGGPEVVLFADCFTMYNEPSVGLAARDVLTRFGYRVRLVDAGCCGRSMISTGMLEEARPTIDATVARLAAAIGPDTAALLVCEPSCLSAIVDDWLQLKLRSSRDVRQRLASLARLPEQFLEERWDQHPARPEFSADVARVLLHEHCHQKAVVGEGTSEALLRRVFGDRLDVLDAGCCGMAGSFGFGESRYDLSMAIGERVLFPAVREAPEALVCAPGTSCRHQILDGAARRPLHPIELIRDTMGDRSED